MLLDSDSIDSLGTKYFEQMPEKGIISYRNRNIYSDLMMENTRLSFRKYKLMFNAL